jgi:PAS domain S-box-containing protein
MTHDGRTNHEPTAPLLATHVTQLGEPVQARLGHVRSKAAQREAEVTYRTLFDSIDEGFCIFELLYDEHGRAVDYRFLDVNRAFEQQTGLVNAVGKRGSELAPRTETSWLGVYDTVVRTGAPQRCEEFHAPTGRWYDVYTSRIGGAGSHLVCTVSSDVSARKRHEANQALLANLSAELVGLTDVAETIQRLGETIGRHFGVQYCILAEYADSLELAIASYGWSAEGAPSLTGTYRTRDFLSTAELEALLTGVSLVVSDTRTDPRVNADTYGALGIRSFIIVPLLRDKQWQFQLSIIDTRPRDWRDDDVALLHELTGRIWTRLERARAEAAVRKNERRMHRQNDAFQAAINGAPLAAALGILARLVIEETAGEARTAFYVADPDGTSLHPIPGAGDMPDAYTEQVDRFPIGADSLACGLAFAMGRPVLTRDVFDEPRWTPWLHLASGYGFRGCWSFPIATRDGSPIGTLALYFPAARVPAPDDLALAEVVTQAAGIIIARQTEAEERARAEAALRASEERHRLIVENARDYAILTLDAAGRITSWARGAEAVFDWTVREALGQRVDMTFTPEDRAAGQPAQDLATARRTGSAPDVRWHVRKDGRRVFIEGTTRALRDGDGRLTGFLKIGQDVTERREREAERERLAVAEAVAAERQALLRRVVEAQEEERQHLAHEVHDSVTQLAHAAAMRLDGLAERLAPHVPAEDAADVARARDLARQAAQEARRLIAGLRPEALDMFGLAGAVGQAVALLRADGWRVALDDGDLVGIRLTPELEITLYRVAQEALTNVRKHTPPGRVQVTLKRRAGVVRLQVRDWGPGFDPHAVQAGAAGRRLGLTGMRERVALLGGQFSLRSASGRGTTVTAVVPLVEPVA